MVLLFFALDLRALSPPLLCEMKQCLLQLANFYAVSGSQSKRRNSDHLLENSIGLCYLQRSAISPSHELKTAYSPRGKGFSLRDFHYAVNHIPSDSYLPSSLDDSGSFLFRDVDFSRILSDEVLYSFGGKDIERKVILISSCLVGNMDFNNRKTLLDAADRCVSMEFVFLEQKSSQFCDISENMTKFGGQICDLENCSFNAYLPDLQVLNGLVKRWFRELKDDTEKTLHARIVFQKAVTGSIYQISCKLCNSINQMIDGFCKACVSDASPWDSKDGCAVKERFSCHVAKHDPGPDDTDMNSMNVSENALLPEASWRSWTNLRQICSAVDLNVIERTSLASLSEGLLVGRPYIVIPSVGQEADTAPEESDQSQLNNQLFLGLCRALYSLNQGLVCWSFCNIETMRETAFRHYYILQPSDTGPLLLRVENRISFLNLFFPLFYYPLQFPSSFSLPLSVAKLKRLAGAEEILPFPDVNQSDPMTVLEVDSSIQQCLQEVELRDYNPVQHTGGFHQKLNELVQKSLQSGLATLELTNTASDLSFHDDIDVPSQSTMARDASAPLGETQPFHLTDDHENGITHLAQEWEQLIVGDVPKMDPLPSEPNVEKPRASPPPATQRPLDSRTSKILERLGNPKQMKTKVTSPTAVSGVATIAAGGITDLTTSSQLMRPTFHRLKRKYR